MVLKIKNKHHSTFRLLSSSRSYRATFDKILFTFYTKSFTISSYIYFITFHFIYFITLLHYPSNYAGKKISLIILQNISVSSFS